MTRSAGGDDTGNATINDERHIDRVSVEGQVGGSGNFAENPVSFEWWRRILRSNGSQLAREERWNNGGEGGGGEV